MINIDISLLIDIEWRLNENYLKIIYQMYLLNKKIHFQLIWNLFNNRLNVI